MCRHTFCLFGILIGSGLAQAQTFYPLTLAQAQVPTPPTASAPFAPQAQPMPVQAPLPVLAPVPSAMRMPMPSAQPDIERVSAHAPSETAADSTSDKLLKFDASRIQVQHRNQHWVVCAGDVVVKDFGTDVQSAHEASRLIRALKLDELGKVGDPTPVMEYWLCDGQDPPLPVGGQHAIAIDPASLRVEMDPMLGRWCVRNNARTLFTSFTREEDARQAVEVIREHGFTHVMTLGQGKPTMQLFVNGTGSATFSRLAVNPADNGSQPSGLSQGSGSEMPIGPALSPGHTDPMVRPVTLNQRSGSDGLTRPITPGRDDPLHDTPVHGGLSTTMGSQGTEAPHQVFKPSEKVAFDFRRAQMRKEKNVCTLTCGGQVLATFGADEADAKKALETMNRYQLTEMHRVGGAQSQFIYFLSHGTAPITTDLIGVHSYSLDLPTLQVRHDGDGYVLANQQQSLWRFSTMDDAQTALGEIHKYNFDRVYYMGNGEGSGFAFLARSK